MSGRGGWGNDRRDSGGGGYHQSRDNNNSNNYGGGGGYHRDGGYNNRDRGRYNGGYNSNNNGPPPPMMRGAPDFHHHHRGGGGGGPPPSQPTIPPNRRKVPPHVIVFNSYEEEMDFVEQRRRKRLARTSRFDVTPEQLGLSAPITIQPSAAVAALTYPPQSLIDPNSSSNGQQSMDPAAIAAAAAAALFAQQQQNSSLATNAMSLPQQTRHARRLYVGNLPIGVTEQQIHHTFRTAIIKCLVPGSGIPDPSVEDPILSVYINHERRFSFLEFKSVELCSACMALDGIEIIPGQPHAKVKRPNDYIPSMAPIETVKPILDISQIGLISSAVLDGPNKIFIGGLHYHLQENQVLELLQAFGKVKAFHLVKNEPDSQLSKGYCFVEYADPAVTPIAIAGLNGMDIGGGKSLTSRLAGERNGMIQQQPITTAAASASVNDGSNGGQPDINNKTIVSGYDIEAIVDAAMGQGSMPQAPSYFDGNGLPLTRIVPIIAGVTPLPNNMMTQPAVPIPTQQQQPGFPQLISPPNTVVNPLYSMNGGALPPQQQSMYMANENMNGTPTQMMMGFPTQQQQQGMMYPSMAMDGGQLPTMTQQQSQPVATKVLVLLNLVSDEDLATDDDYNGLVEEVREECSKYGTLLQVQIPRYMGKSPDTGATIESSALRKVFLSYATIDDAMKAQQELSGRQFGPSVVETEFYPETDFAVGLFR